MLLVWPFCSLSLKWWRCCCQYPILLSEWKKKKITVQPFLSLIEYFLTFDRIEGLHEATFFNSCGIFFWSIGCSLKVQKFYVPSNTASILKVPIIWGYKFFWSDTRKIDWIFPAGKSYNQWWYLFERRSKNFRPCFHVLREEKYYHRLTSSFTLKPVCCCCCSLENGS